MPEPIISVSGLRGVVGESLTPEVALRFACAFAEEIKPGPIVITRDGRATGRMLADAIRSGLQAVGRDVIDADVAATPTTGVLVRHVGAAGGIQISASHNPSEYNGLKLFSAAGQVISASEGQKVIARYRAGGPRWVRHSGVGAASTYPDPDSPHKVLVERTVNVARLQGAHFNVLLDSNHGAGSDLGSMLLESLGCRVTVLGGEPDGKFEHLPEPTAENLATVLQRVPQTQAHIGFCQDPDADRLAIIDEHGRYLGEEYTLALVVDHLLRQRKGPVVTN
ncbi:MAG: phosphoglucosamine mutase, partial [Planctomycetaceae bacterium]|nr:phosphoglucosamine mutase [Planctomycetaceae bacterium]